MKYTKDDKRCWLILQCRYYKGEKEPPKEIKDANNGLLWDYEHHWVEEQLNSPLLDIEYEHQAKSMGVTLATWDDTPLSLKLLLFERWLHWSSGYKTMEQELKSFDISFYSNYVSRPTNKERRMEERSDKLKEDCRLYKTKWNNPYVSDPVKDFLWHSEKEWVDALADSYSNRERFFKELMSIKYFDPYPLDYWKNYAHHHNIPATLLACIAKNYAKDYYKGFKHEMQEYFEHFISEYSKM